MTRRRVIKSVSFFNKEPSLKTAFSKRVYNTLFTIVNKVL
jgi:hypothetical protein